jgi:hypothetical protein
VRTRSSVTLVLGALGLALSGCAGNRFASVVTLPPLQSPKGSPQWCTTVAATCLNRCEGQEAHCQDQCDTQRRECLNAAAKE